MANFYRITFCSVLVLSFLLTGCAAQTQVKEQQPTPENTSEIIEDISDTPQPQATQPLSDPVEGWAVLLEKDEFSDVGKTNLPVDYIDNQRLKDLLLNSGWDSRQIHDVRGFDRTSLQFELDWLESVADENDIVFLYVTTHGMHMVEDILWEDFFESEWAQIESQNRVLLLETCFAARFTDVVKDDSDPQLTIAAVGEEETGWKGLEEEGLPIVGGVFTFYFTEAFKDSAADKDYNGLISIQEAALYAEDHQRQYMHDTVFAVPEFLAAYKRHEMGWENDPEFPDVIVNDAIGKPLYFSLAVYE